MKNLRKKRKLKILNKVNELFVFNKTDFTDFTNN